MDVMRRGSRTDPISLIDAAIDVRDYPGMPAIIVHSELDSVVTAANAEQLTRQFLRLNNFVDAAGERRAGEALQDTNPDGVVSDYIKEWAARREDVDRTRTRPFLGGRRRYGRVQFVEGARFVGGDVGVLQASATSERGRA